MFISGEQKEKMELDEDEDVGGTSEELILTSRRVTSFNFPTYVAPDVKDDMVGVLTKDLLTLAFDPCIFYLNGYLPVCVLLNVYGHYVYYFVIHFYYS
jgi:hypothetical protein